MKKKQTIEVVINSCFGGFGLSHEAFLELRKLGNKTALSEPDIGELWDDKSGPRESYYDTFCRDIDRDDKDLISVVKQLKEKANGMYAKLRIVKIPSDIKWQIEEYDGSEHIAEQHRTW